MSNARPEVRAGASRVALSAAGLVVALGVALAVRGTGGPGPVPLPDGGTRPRHRAIRIPLDGGVPANAVWFCGTYRMPPSALRAHGLSDQSGRDEYVRVCMPAAPTDAGSMGPPAGAVAVEDTFSEEPLGGRANEVAVAMQGEASSWECACSSGAGCLQPDGGEVPLGVTMGPGQWSGTGCYPKACVEHLGASSWPPVCPQGGTP